MVLEGYDRKTAAEVCGMDRQTLRNWVHRYNAEGLEGLSNRRSGGRPARMNQAKNPARHSIFETYDEFVVAYCQAWNFFARDPDAIQSIATRDYAKTVSG